MKGASFAATLAIMLVGAQALPAPPTRNTGTQGAAVPVTYDTSYPKELKDLPPDSVSFDKSTKASKNDGLPETKIVRPGPGFPRVEENRQVADIPSKGPVSAPRVGNPQPAVAPEVKKPEGYLNRELAEGKKAATELPKKGKELPQVNDQLPSTAPVNGQSIQPRDSASGAPRAPGKDDALPLASKVVKPILKQADPILKGDKSILKGDKSIPKDDKSILKGVKPFLRHGKPEVKGDKPILKQSRPVVKDAKKPSSVPKKVGQPLPPVNIPIPVKNSISKTGKKVVTPEKIKSTVSKLIPERSPCEACSGGGDE